MLHPGSLLLRFAAPLFVAATAQTQTVLFSDDFENGAANWDSVGYWHLANEGPPCLDNAFPSGSHCMWYGRESTCTFDKAWGPESLRLAVPLALPANAEGVFLDYWTRSQVEEDTTWDTREVDVSTDGGVGWTTVHQILPSSEPWTFHTVDLTAYAGHTIDLRFSFWAGDLWKNNYLGWLVDDVVIRTVPQAFPTTCFGDASAAACPCSNSGGAGRGCQNSAGTGGAHLSISGSTSPDTIVLQASGELPNALTIFLQGTANVAPVDFGDGVRCAGGPLKRLYVKNASGGVAIAPALGDPSVSERATALGDVLDPGSRRYYQTYYRDPNTGFCAPPLGANFNASQMRRITW
jgi:hypothetical protein